MRMCEQKAVRPQYEALDSRGAPYLRQARVVGELPSPQERKHALGRATEAIASELGLPPLRTIPFGGLVADAFMPLRLAKKHAACRLLLTRGDAVALDHCPTYNRQYEGS